MTATLLARVVDVLEKQHIPFALIGAAAMAAHGTSRSTYDTDLFCVGPASLQRAVWQSLIADGIEVDVREGDDDDPLLGVVRCVHGEQAIDVVVGRARWQQDVIARAKTTYVFSLNLPIVLVEDLILLKLYAGGIQDRWDIQQLLITAGAALTIGDVDARVLSLPERCQALWAQLRPSVVQ